MATYTSQYADGTSNAGALGNLALGDDGTNLQSLLVSSAGRLSIDVNSGTVTVTQATGTNLHAVLDALTPGVAAANLGKQHDVAAAAADVGIAALGIRNDALSSTINNTNLAYGSFAVDAAGRVWIAGSALDNTSWTQGSSRDVIIAGVFDDTAPVIALEDKISTFRISSRRELYTQLRDAAGGERGANVTAANELLVNVNGGTVAVTQGTGTALHAVIDALVPGVNTTSLGKAVQTVLYASGDTGVLALAVRNDALATINSTNLNYGALAVDAAGRIAVTASQFDDAVFTPEVSGLTVVGGVAFETAPDMVGESDAGALRMSRRRELYTRSEVIETLLKNLNDMIELSSLPFAAQDIKNMLLGLSITTSVVTTTIPAQSVNITLLRPNASRRTASIVNDSTGTLYVKCGAGATTTSYTVKMPIGSYFELPQPPWIGQVDALGTTTVGNYLVTEYA